MLVGHGKQLTGQVLDHQTGHKILGSILLRQDQEDRRPFPYKGFRIDASVKADNLFQLRIQKGIQLGKHCGHDGIHALIRSSQRRACQPFGFVVGG